LQENNYEAADKGGSAGHKKEINRTTLFTLDAFECTETSSQQLE
jgi:hypothetical protein